MVIYDEVYHSCITHASFFNLIISYHVTCLMGCGEAFCASDAQVDAWLQFADNIRKVVVVNDCTVCHTHPIAELLKVTNNT